MKLDRKFFSTLFFCLFYLTPVFAIDFKKSDIKIIGNKSISEETILNYTDSGKETLNTEELNTLQKKLFETNFFSSIEVKIVENKVVIHLKENPLVEYLTVTGLSKRQDFLPSIEKIISLKENNVFSENVLNKDIKSINEFLSSNGYFQSYVDYKVNLLANNKVNLFFDIVLNQQFFAKNIFFIGNKKFSTSTLQSVISTTESSWLDFFKTSSIPSVDRVNQDVSSLKKFYLNKGYYDVQIPSASIDIMDKKYANIIFTINAGNKYIFEKFTINNKALSLKDKDLLFLDREIKSFEKKDYSPDSLSKLLKIIRDYFDSNSITVNIDYALNKIGTDVLSVAFDIEEIYEKRFINNIVVKGNDITEEAVIRNNIFFSEGDLYSQLKISKSIDSLKALSFFKNVKFSTVDVKNSNNIDIVILLEEQPTGEVSAGAGFGTAGAVLNFSLKEKNFLGKGIATNTSLILGTQKILGNLSFTDPDFRSNGNSFTGKVFANKYTYDNAAYDNKVTGASIATSYEALKDINLETGFALDLDSIDARPGASSIIQLRDGEYVTSKFFYNVYNDKRNKKFQPTSGYTAGFGQGLATLVSDVPFISNTIFGSFYKELAADFVGSIRYKIKSINAIGEKDIKLSDRIFLSEYELRGFSYREVGPKLSNEFVGGNYSYSTNFSSTIPNGLPDAWGTRSNVFVDVANVWGADFSADSNVSKIRSSVGVGFEWVSPLGPISFTYTEPISKDSSDIIENFNFKLGGTF